MFRIFSSFLVVMLLGGAFAGPLGAQIPAGVEGSYEPHPEANKAISRLLSPYCPGFMLEVCPSSEAQALRDTIHARALQGESADELVDWMLADYGEEYRAMPQNRGSGLFAWVLPPLALLMGVLGVVMALRRFRPDHAAEGLASDGASASSASPDQSLDPQAEDRLREAIRELELSEDPL